MTGRRNNFLPELAFNDQLFDTEAVIRKLLFYRFEHNGGIQ